jgi:NADH:ubiquinone oxidoreductase subunit 6 (subunit J)
MLSTRSATAPSAPDRRAPSFMIGVLWGLAPLGMLIGAFLLTVAATSAVRALLITQGFALQHAALPLVLGVGLLVATVGAVVGVKQVLTRMRRWDEAGEVERARGSRWALLITALLVALPVFLAFVFPQSPAVAR